MESIKLTRANISELATHRKLQETFLNKVEKLKNQIEKIQEEIEAQTNLVKFYDKRCLELTDLKATELFKKHQSKNGNLVRNIYEIDEDKYECKDVVENGKRYIEITPKQQLERALEHNDNITDVRTLY
jgi:anion-transporting  ArsA/GET3 family ATPase